MGRKRPVVNGGPLVETSRKGKSSRGKPRTTPPEIHYRGLMQRQTTGMPAMREVVEVRAHGRRGRSLFAVDMQKIGLGAAFGTRGTDRNFRSDISEGDRVRRAMDSLRSAPGQRSIAKFQSTEGVVLVAWEGTDMQIILVAAALEGTADARKLNKTVAQRLSPFSRSSSPGIIRTQH